MRPLLLVIDRFPFTMTVAFTVAMASPSAEPGFFSIAIRVIAACCAISLAQESRMMAVIASKPV